MLISLFAPSQRRVVRVLAGFAAALWLASAAAAPPTVLLEQMTWTELDARIKAGATTVLVPIGGTEQNGPDIALGKHNLRALRLAERIASALGQTVVAPVVAYVPEGSPTQLAGHMQFPGTLSVPSQAFMAVLEGAGESLRVHGVRRVVFLCDHGGYQDDVRAAAAVLNRRWAGQGAQAVALDAYYRAASSGFAALLKQQGFRDDEIGTHAGLADTSLTLALAPELVRSDRLSADAGKGARVGLHGDSTRASAALGAQGVELIVTQSVDAIRALQK